MADIADGSVDAICADLPYGSTACAWDSVIPFAPMWQHFRRVCKPNAAIVLTASQPFTSALIMSNPKMFKYCWVWVKNRPTGAQQAKNWPMKKHEDIAVFSSASMGHASLLGQNRMAYFPQGVSDSVVKVVKAKGFHAAHIGARPNQVGREYVSQTDFPHTILEFAKDEGHEHPTQKPVALMAYLIRTYTQAGETVLDCTMGSGTTGVACKQEGRNFIGIERDPAYFAVAQKRIADCDSLLSFGNAVLHPKDSP